MGHIVQTGEACPDCGIALTLHFGTSSDVDAVATHMQSEYDLNAPADWSDNYEHPVYVHCDNPVCSYHGAVEWTDIRPVLEVWIEGDAPTWEEYVEAVQS